MAKADNRAEVVQGRRVSFVAGRRPTIKMVAERAGVSLQTVSNACNAPNRLRPETLRTVLAVIEELGYRPNQAARCAQDRRHPHHRLPPVAEQLRGNGGRARRLVPCALRRGPVKRVRHPDVLGFDRRRRDLHLCRLVAAAGRRRFRAHKHPPRGRPSGRGDTAEGRGVSHSGGPGASGARGTPGSMSTAPAGPPKRCGTLLASATRESAFLASTRAAVSVTTAIGAGSARWRDWACPRRAWSGGRWTASPRDGYWPKRCWTHRGRPRPSSACPMPWPWVPSTP